MLRVMRVAGSFDVLMVPNEDIEVVAENAAMVCEVAEIIIMPTKANMAIFPVYFVLRCLFVFGLGLGLLCIAVLCGILKRKT